MAKINKNASKAPQKERKAKRQKQQKESE